MATSATLRRQLDARHVRDDPRALADHWMAKKMQFARSAITPSVRAPAVPDIDAFLAEPLQRRGN